MKRFTRSLAVVLSVLMLFSVVLVGCSQKEEAPAPEASGEKALDYPNKSIQLVIPYKPGGDTDLSARVYAKYMSEELGENVVVVNMTGAGGSVASQHVKDANTDGYTALYWHPSFILNKTLGVVDYDHNDFEIAGISTMADTDVLVVSADSPYETVNDFVEAAKANPNSVKYAASVGAYSYAQAVALEQATGAEFNKVDVGGQADKTAAVLGGHLDAFVGMYAGVKDYVESGDFRILGQYGENRSPYLPEIPTLNEQGVNVVFDKFYFTAMPKGTDKEIVERYSEAMKNVVNSDGYKTDLQNIQMVAKYYNSEDAFDFITGQFEFYGQFTEDMLSAKE